MQLKDVMTRSVESVAPDTTVREAAERMASLDVGFLPVLEAGYPVGVVTDRDIAVRVVAPGRDAQLSVVRDIMSLDVETESETQSLEEAAKRMEEKQIRRILVQNEQGEMVGVVSLGDLAVSSGNPHLSGEALEKVSGPSKPGH